MEYTLKKKHFSVAYKKVHENYAKEAARIAYKPTATNLANKCTKVLFTAAKDAKIKHILC